MKVLFLMIAYPDVEHNSNMYTDLTGVFVNKGHEVYVCAPHNSKTEMKIEGNVNVLRIKTLPLFNTSLALKIAANLLLPYQYRRAVVEHLDYITFDLIITPTPPITFLGIVRLFKREYKSIFYLILRDIFPQNAKDLGIIKNKFIYNYYRRKEKRLYKIADYIGCMSSKNIEYVITENPEVRREKLHLLPNWSSIEERSKEKSSVNSDIIHNLKLEKKFVAVFGGNFGRPQKVEFLLEIAERLLKKKDILFLLIGEGTEKARLKQMINDRNLVNVRILDSLSREEYNSLLDCCDLGLVCLSDKFTIPNIPSRTLSYWAAGLPVLAATDANTDLGDIIRACNGGLWTETGNHDEYIRHLMSMYLNPSLRKEMGNNGYRYLASELTPEKTFSIINSIIVNHHV